MGADWDHLRASFWPLHATKRMEEQIFPWTQLPDWPVAAGPRCTGLWLSLGTEGYFYTDRIKH